MPPASRVKDKANCPAGGYTLRGDCLYSTGTGEYSPRRTERPADPVNTLGWVRFDNSSGRGNELHVPYRYKQDIKDMLPGRFKKNAPIKPVKSEE